MDGLLCLNKPVGITTFDVVRAVRRTLGERSIGHAGTLDPAATGLVITALGNATSLLAYLAADPKVYDFEIRFGTATDSQDDTGNVISSDGAVPSEAQIRAIFPAFTGTITQRPPIFSAVKIRGVRAYTRARRSETFETSPREIRIDAFEMKTFDASAGVCRCRVVCSSGTYVRAIASDIGTALGTFAHAAGIHRVAAGRFSVDGAPAPDACADDLRGSVMTVKEAFSNVAAITLDESQAREMSFGRPVQVSQTLSPPVLAFLSGGELAGVLTSKEPGLYRPLRVFLKTADWGGAR